MRLVAVFLLLVPLGLFVYLAIPTGSHGLQVGSKKFTESVILGELLAQLGTHATGGRVVHRAELGGTRVLWNALLSGDIDVYPEYTGTLAKEVLAGRELTTLADIRAAVEAQGLRMSAPVGFNNSYALGMLRSTAERLGLSRISQLRSRPELRLGFTNEFMDRQDGWPGLQRHYRLPHDGVRGMDHDLAYQALANGSIDVTDLYTTDAKIQKYDLAILADDDKHFPRYDAVVLYRADLERRSPRLVSAIHTLEGTIDASQMVALNAEVELQQRAEAAVAADHLRRNFGIESQVQDMSIARRIVDRTREHLRLVLVSLAGAIVVSIPLGVWAAKRPRQGQFILGVVGIIQTVPSLALLVILMKPFAVLSESLPALRDVGVGGIGAAPAIAALFLYSLLPIVRNTAAGLTGIAPELRESAEALGMLAVARLWRIELPLAAPTVLAGIKTSAVVNIGFATLGALIGAGGYGQPILTGIRLDDYGLILQGALPAAGLAVLAQAWFELAERVIVPRGLRVKTGQ